LIRELYRIMPDDLENKSSIRELPWWKVLVSSAVQYTQIGLNRYNQ
jgi:hypothetical protein